MAIWTILGGIALIGVVAAVILLVVRLARRFRREQHSFPVNVSDRNVQGGRRPPGSDGLKNFYRQGAKRLFSVPSPDQVNLYCLGTATGATGAGPQTYPVGGVRSCLDSMISSHLMVLPE